MHPRARWVSSIAIAALAVVAVLADASPAAAVETQITISSTSIDFGSVNVGATSPETSVTLTNGGSDSFGPINIFGGAPPTAEFNASQNCQGVTLPAGGNCKVNYTFSPGASKQFTDTSSFTISETASQSDGEAFSVALKGTGTGGTPTTTTPTTTTKPSTTTTKPAATTTKPTTGGGGGTTTTTAAPQSAPQATVAHESIALGEEQNATARGFRPREVVSAVQQPNGLDLGTRVADDSGVVRFSWTVAASEPPGTYEFVATGAQSGTVTATFTVVKASDDDDSGSSGLIIGVIVVIVLLAVAGAVFYAYRRRLQAADHTDDTDTTPQP